MGLRQGRSFYACRRRVWLSNGVSVCRGLVVVWLARGTAPVVGIRSARHVQPMNRTATLASRVRVLGTGQSTKRDDTGSVAVAALHAPTLPVVRVADHVTVCGLLAKRHSDLARWRNKLCCRLHALVAELVPGGIDKEMVDNQARSLLDGIQPDDVAAVERHRLAAERRRDRPLDDVAKDSRHASALPTASASGHDGDPRSRPLRRLHRHSPPSSSPPEAGSPTGCRDVATGDSITPCTSWRSRLNSTGASPARRQA